MAARTLLDRPVRFPDAAGLGSRRGRLPYAPRPTLLGLPRPSTDAVLERLGFSDRPAPDRAGLDAVYLAWCRQVPFDNVVKRIHLASGSADRSPTVRPSAFFAAYLRDGTGGTCWPSSGGLHALLVALGFDARRGSAAMRDDLSGPIHTHGTVHRPYRRRRLLGGHLDAHRPGVPAACPARRRTSTIRCTRCGSSRSIELWRVWWTHPFLDEKLGCLLLDDDVTAEHYLARYEWSREHEPVQHGLHATHNFDGARVDRRVRSALRAPRRRHHVDSRSATTATAVLIEEFGYSEAIVAQLPEDEPDPVGNTTNNIPAAMPLQQ